jgi:hypothetical protein
VSVSAHRVFPPRPAVVVLAVLSSTACQTVHFIRPSARPAAPQRFWHHSVVSALVEASEPVNLLEQCPSGWARVSTRESIATALAPGAVSQVTGGRTDGLWDPEEVEVSCDLAGASSHGP